MLAVWLSVATAQAVTVQAVIAPISANSIERRVKALSAFGTRHTASETQSETRGIGAARRWIERELRECSSKSGGRLEVSTQRWQEPPGRGLPHGAELVNVLATLPAASQRGPSRVLVVSGHYDSRNSNNDDALGDAPGANDDASGTAVVMELACAFAPHTFDATIIFLAVSGEEQGLLGATHFARLATSSSLPIEAMITNDIVGSATGEQGQRDPNRIRLFAGGVDPLLQAWLQMMGRRPVDPSEQAFMEGVQKRVQSIALAGGAEDLPAFQLARYIKRVAEHNVPDLQVQLIKRRDRYLRGGDHLPFLERGYAAVRMTEPFENFRHQHQDVRMQDGKSYGDLPEFVEPEYVATVAKANGAALASLAWAPPPPSGVLMDVSVLTNNTTLSWNKDPSGLATAYRVHWRQTDAVTWEGSQQVDTDTTVTLPLSKDSYIFGVSSISERGFESLAVYPMPRR